MYCVLSFTSVSQARRCVRFCRESSVLAEILPKSRYYDGKAQVRINSKFESLVYGAFRDFICSSLVYAW